MLFSVRSFAPRPRNAPAVSAGFLLVLMGHITSIPLRPVARRPCFFQPMGLWVLLCQAGLAVGKPMQVGPKSHRCSMLIELLAPPYRTPSSDLLGKREFLLGQ